MTQPPEPPEAPDPAESTEPPGAEQPAPPTRRRQPPEVRRRMLVDAARAVIAERGLHAVTVRDVAAAGGVAVGTVTYHFQGMADVLAEVLRSEMAEFSAPILQRARDAGGRAGLEIVVDGLLASDAATHDHWMLWLDFWALAARYPRYAQWQAEVYRDLHALIRDCLPSGGSTGGIDGEAAGGDQAVEFVALLDGLVVQCYLPGSPLAPARGRQMMRDFLSRTGG